MALELLTTKDAAGLLGLGVERIRQLEKAGQLPAIITARGQRIFLRETVEHFASSRERERAGSSPEHRAQASDAPSRVRASAHGHVSAVTPVAPTSELEPNSLL